MRSKTTPNAAEFDQTKLLERPDGFFWLDQATGKSYGPFATLVEAQQDMDFNAGADFETDFEAEDSLDEIEEELGLAAWVDPDTGELAEDTLTHLEDH